MTIKTDVQPSIEQLKANLRQAQQAVKDAQARLRKAKKQRNVATRDLVVEIISEHSKRRGDDSEPMQTKVEAMKRKLEEAVVPHYTQENVLEIFRKGTDPRLVSNVYGTATMLELSQEAGFFHFGKKDGKGIVAFWLYEDGERKLVFTADCVITEPIRNGICTDDDCGCHPWDQIWYSCHCDHHHWGVPLDILPRIELCRSKHYHEGELRDILPRIEWCPKERGGPHVHLLGFCEVCYLLDVSNGKKDPTADNFEMLVREAE